MGKAIVKHGVNVREFNEQHWEFIGNLNKEEYELHSFDKTTRASYKCKHCGKVVNRQKGGFKKYLLICPNECNGVKHGSSGRVTLKGVNDVATTHPHLVKYFVNKEDTCRYSANSMKQVEVKCPNCEMTKRMILKNLTTQGLGCPTCSDGISYPERFIANLLKQLGIEFKKEYTLDNGRTRYDFYLPSYNCIIEVHGLQHYKESARGRSLEEEQLNDKYKHKKAIKKGIRCYIVIDARESTMEWMKNSVMNSGLPILLGIRQEDVDWNAIASNCEKSLVKDVCDYFNEHGGTTYSIGEVFGIDRTTVSSYLKRGTEFGWCEYNDEVKKRIRECKSVRGFNMETGQVIDFINAREAGKWLIDAGVTTNKYVQNKIYSCCIGERLSAYGYKWEYID